MKCVFGMWNKSFETINHGMASSALARKFIQFINRRAHPKAPELVVPLKAHVL